MARARATIPIELPAAGLVHVLDDGTYLWAYRDDTGRIVCGNEPSAARARDAMAASRAERALWAMRRRPSDKAT